MNASFVVGNAYLTGYGRVALPVIRQEMPLRHSKNTQCLCDSRDLATTF